MSRMIKSIKQIINISSFVPSSWLDYKQPKASKHHFAFKKKMKLLIFGDSRQICCNNLKKLHF